MLSASRCILLAAIVGCAIGVVTAFQPTTSGRVARSSHATVQRMAKNSNSNSDEEFMRWAKQSRSASVTDNKVELLRPLGLILNQDENGNVYVETLAPKGNAARSGKVSHQTIQCAHIRVLFSVTSLCVCAHTSIGFSQR
jgi:cell division protein FtsL